MITGMTNGVFDILHVGHVRFLEACSQFCDELVVCINSDSSTRALKGSGRPVFGEKDRCAILSALSCVDRVEVFHEQTVAEAMRHIRPCIWFKGSPYTLDTINPMEMDVCKMQGIHVHLIPRVSPLSTTGIIERVIKHAIDSGLVAAPNPA